MTDWNELARIPREEIKSSYATTAADLLEINKCDPWDVAFEAVVNGLTVIQSEEPELAHEFADMAERMLKQLRMNADQLNSSA